MCIRDRRSSDPDSLEPVFQTAERLQSKKLRPGHGRHAVSYTHLDVYKRQVLESAENFPVPVEVDRVYFFNPFSLEILRKAMARLLESYYENPREIQLFFYYPSDAYISYLMTVPELEFLDEIDCMDLFPGGDSRERVVIFTIQE